jgi:formylglycine-generating enzyme required for sulfatase activity
MSGNVWEWCLNEYEKPERIQDGGDALRVVRGGSWLGSPDAASARIRSRFFPSGWFSYYGFRVVLVVSVPIHPDSAL